MENADNKVLSKVFPRGYRSLLLLVLVISSYMIYQKSTNHAQLQKKSIQALASAASVASNNKKGHGRSSKNIKKVYVDIDGNEISPDQAAQAIAEGVHGGSIIKEGFDREGNEIPVFDDNTLFPKPGGGYCDMTAIEDKEQYFQALENPTVKCNDLQQFSQYQVCMDGFKKKGNCVVLSFGINYDFSFDELTIDRLGCKAYSFDPTMDRPSYVKIRNNGMGEFRSLGLSSYKGVKIMDYETRRRRTGQVDRYVNIINMLEFANKKIDFLKINIEGSELDFFLDTASNHPELIEKVKQIQLEFHNLEECCYWHSGNRKDTTQFDMMKIVDILHCHGFALAHTRGNDDPKLHFMYHEKKRSLTYITTWIRA